MDATRSEIGAFSTFYTLSEIESNLSSTFLNKAASERSIFLSRIENFLSTNSEISILFLKISYLMDLIRPSQDSVASRFIFFSLLKIRYFHLRSRLHAQCRAAS